MSDEKQRLGGTESRNEFAGGKECEDYFIGGNICLHSEDTGKYISEHNEVASVVVERQFG